MWAHQHGRGNDEPVNKLAIVNGEWGASVLYYMSASSTLAHFSTAARKAVDGVAAYLQEHAAPFFGSVDEERLPNNVERHGRHLLVRVPVPAEPDHQRPGSRHY